MPAEEEHIRHVERHYGERVPSERRQRPVDGCRAREIPDVEQDDDCGRRPAVEQKAVAGQVGAEYVEPEIVHPAIDHCPCED